MRASEEALRYEGSIDLGEMIPGVVGLILDHPMFWPIVLIVLSQAAAIAAVEAWEWRKRHVERKAAESRQAVGITH